MRRSVDVLLCILRSDQLEFRRCSVRHQERCGRSCTRRGCNEVQLQTCCNISVKEYAILNISFQYGLSIEYIGLILNHISFFSFINIWFTSILCSIPCTSNSHWYKTIYLLRSRILTVIAYDHTLLDTLQMRARDAPFK